MHVPLQNAIILGLKNAVKIKFKKKLSSNIVKRKD